MAVRFRLTSVGDVHRTADKVAVEVTEAVRGDAWLVMSPELSESLGRLLSPEVLDKPSEAPRDPDDPWTYPPGNEAGRAIGGLILSKEFTNWRDLSGPKNRAMAKRHRDRLETELDTLRRALAAVLDEPIEDFLEDLSEWENARGARRWRYNRTLNGYRKP